MSLTYHPQSDEGAKRVNQCLEQYSRSMTCHNPKNWSIWLDAADWWYNTIFHTTLNITPYQVVYGVQPRHIDMGARVHTNLHCVESMIEEKYQ